VQNNEVRQADAMIRFFFKLDPSRMTDKVWVARTQESLWVLEKLSQLVSVKSE
jgi:hypothetical protein